MTISLFITFASPATVTSGIRTWVTVPKESIFTVDFIGIQAELELDKVLDRLIESTIKNHEAKVNKVITKLTDQAEKELTTATTQLTNSYRQTFDQKLDVVISEWSDHQRQTLATALDEKQKNLATISEALVQKVAEQSLKKHLTLREHDQLVKNSLTDIGNNLR